MSISVRLRPLSGLTRGPRGLLFLDFIANALQHCVNPRPVLWFDQQAEAFQLFLLESQSPEFLVIHSMSPRVAVITS